MKQTLITSLFCFLLLLTNCGKEDIPNKAPEISIINPSNNADISFNSSFDVLFNASDSDGEIVKIDLFLDNRRIKSINDESNSFRIIASEIGIGQHILKAIATDDKNAQGESNSITFKISVSEGTISDFAEKERTDTTITFTYKIDDLGGGSIIKTGICWSTSGNPTIEDNEILAEEIETIFLATISNTSPTTIYYVRAFLENEEKLNYSPIVQVTSNEILGLVETISIDEAIGLSAKATGKVINTGGNNTRDFGFVWSLNTNATIGDQKISVNQYSNSSSYDTVIELGEANTTYYIRSYFENGRGIVYGDELTVLTDDFATIQLNNINNITDSAITASIALGDLGRSEIIEKGIILSARTSEFDVSNADIVSVLDEHTSTKSINGLIPNTVYYLKAYVKNEVGYSYSENTEIKTKPTSPQVSISKIVNITETSALIEIEVDDNGGDDIIQNGVYYSHTNNNPSESDKIMIANGSSILISDLNSNTKYHVKPFAKNSYRTGLGKVEEFRTLEILSSDQLIKYDDGNFEANVFSTEKDNVFVQTFDLPSQFGSKFEITNAHIYFSSFNAFSEAQYDLIIYDQFDTQIDSQTGVNVFLPINGTIIKRNLSVNGQGWNSVSLNHELNNSRFAIGFKSITDYKFDVAFDIKSDDVNFYRALIYTNQNNRVWIRNGYWGIRLTIKDLYDNTYSISTTSKMIYEPRNLRKGRGINIGESLYIEKLNISNK
ncbi:Ig-like domain-containing protein [Ekhidna sp.]|uniref:Ig-like domain-containing protein n=1 Tax=Ekhidna sp. TaxID=2608089 RepID=UPI003CCC0EFC